MSTEQIYADFDIKIKEQPVPILIQPQEYAAASSHDLLVKELELFSEYYTFRLHDPELNTELSRFAENAVQRCKTTSRINDPEDAVREMIKELIGVDTVLNKYHYDKHALIR